MEIKDYDDQRAGGGRVGKERHASKLRAHIRSTDTSCFETVLNYAN